MPRYDSDFFADRFNAEVDRKDKLRAQASVPIGLAFISASTIKTLSAETSGIFGVIALTAASVALIGTAAFVIKFYFVTPGEPHLPFFAELDKYIESLSDKDDISGILQKSLDGYHKEGADLRAKENDRRSKLLYRMNFSVAASLLLTGLAAAVPISQNMLESLRAKEHDRAISPAPAPAPAAAAADEVHQRRAGTT